MDFFKESKQTFQTNFNSRPAFIDKLNKSLIIRDRDSSDFLKFIQPCQILLLNLNWKSRNRRLKN